MTLREQTSGAPDFQPAQPSQLIRLAQVMEIAGLGKTMIYRLVRQGRFPQPCKPGGFATRWDRNEVLAWKAEQLQKRVS